MKLASMIDHTILKPEAGKEQVETICREAREYGFASVCVNSSYVPLCAELLRDTEVKVCTVIGFPLGAMSTAAKAAEARQAILDGAEELDMVIHIGMLKDGNNEYVEQDIHSVVEEARGKAAVKVIIETCLLSEEEKIRACLLAKKAGADYVKTSTGFSTGGATAEDIALMKKTVGKDMKVKASGGIRTREKAEEMRKAGADRIGTSSGIRIVEAM
ncbi:deoxyribose-phosphate aldolase [Claveliimonas bilis]|uniref:deoxyribose-phosphate aldolase n=1 Tax=Clostridia TaxID=186801 RepID=UPI001E5E5553|nr:deoxyribose-phosphate aldolase [Claveliimonas bilis]MCQ5201872.1 deoxyribose-phosphate aldolase [Mordavella massiliensis]BCZ28579.1 deoxyribose-phosphate aldolase [Claveliimonas bilis]